MEHPDPLAEPVAKALAAIDYPDRVGGDEKFAGCLVMATTRADVNGLARLDGLGRRAE